MHPATQTHAAVRRNFRPLRIATYQYPRRLRRDAVALADRLGSCEAAAYLYDVTPSTLSRWRSALIRDGHLTYDKP